MITGKSVEIEEDQRKSDLGRLEEIHFEIAGMIAEAGRIVEHTFPEQSRHFRKKWIQPVLHAQDRYAETLRELRRGEGRAG